MSRTGDQFLTSIRIKTKDPNLTFATVADYLNSSIDEVRSDYRITSAIRRETLRIFPDVNEYPLPVPTGATETDFESICDLVEWFEGAQSMSRFNRVTPARFARKYSSGYQDNYISPYIRNAQKMLLVDYSPDADSAELNACDTATENGTWTASGDANNLTSDDQTYVEGSGSLNFDITPSALSAILTNSSMAAVDLSDYENNAHLFCYVYIPSATYITSFTLKWGSDASNYFSKSVTTQFNGLAFADGWNLLGFDWNGAVETGTADTDNIDYLQFTMVYSASQSADTDFRLDYITCKQGVDMYFHYNSNMYIKNAAGVLQKIFSDATDYFIGNNVEATLIEWKAIELIHTQEIIDDLKAAKAEAKYNKILRNLKAQNPQQELNSSVLWTGKGLQP